MGLVITKNAEWELIHSAYGIELKGKRGIYDSCFNGEEEVWTDISVNGREFRYPMGMGGVHIHNRAGDNIINMDSDKDLVCYMFAHREREMDDYEFEQFWRKEYFSPFWKHHTRNRMLRERQEEIERAEQEKREAERKAELDKLKAYADKKKFYMIVSGDKAYFIKLDKRNADAPGRIEDSRILQFAQDYPGNGVDIVEEREVGA